jgi:hypothetical protein
MGELSDNMSELTHGFKQWGSCCTLFEFSVLCLVNLFSMLSVSSLMALRSGVRVVHMGELTDNIENKLTKHNTENSNNVKDEPHYLKPWVNSLTTWKTS